MLKSLLACLVFLGMTGPLAAADFTIDVGMAIKPVDHAAAGALYGIAGPGWPPATLIAPLHPKNFTQMAPDGRQLPNGETAPVGDALLVAPIAAAAGASVTIRLPDTFPDFPYIWRGDLFWATEVHRIVAATVAADPANIYAYEIWNEPDWTWQAGWGDFDAVWASTYKSVRAADQRRPILGPSASTWNEPWMRHFLAAAIASRSVPDIISWHELDPAAASDIEAHVAAFRALERSLGLPAHRISINEYGSQRAMGDPGALTHYIAQLERAGVDTADLAFWHRPGRLSDLLVPQQGGRGPATAPLPTGAYWLYAWYGEMRGQMVSARASAATALDGFAAYDPDQRTAEIVLGGAAGSFSVDIAGLADLGPTVTVEATVTHSTGTDGAETSPEPVFTGAFAVGAGAISVPVRLDRADDAMRLQLRPAPIGEMRSASRVQPSPRPPTLRLEAENGAITGGRKFTIPRTFGANHASGDAYAGLFARSGAALTLQAEATAAGTYAAAIAYSNAQATALAIDLAVDGGPPVRLTLPPTQGRELFGLVHTRLDLPAGRSTLTLSLAGPLPALALGPSVLEVDYLELSPAAAP